MASVGRLSYIHLGREVGLPADRSLDVMRAHAHRLLDVAYTAACDAARSYGRADDFLAGWLHARPDAQRSDQRRQRTTTGVPGAHTRLTAVE